MIDRPILITGCARSGTSMTAGIIHLCGAFGGEMSGPNRNNKRGMFENIFIRQNLVKPLLREFNVDPLGQFPLLNIDRADIYDQLCALGNTWKRRVMHTLCKERYQGDRTWFYKGAKMCLMWPLWHTAFPEAKWVIVRRKDDDVINSCLKTGFMRAHRTVGGWQEWINEHKNRFLQMKEQGLLIFEVWPQNIVNGQFDEIKSVIKELGLQWNSKLITDFVTPALWSGGKKNG